MVDMRVLVVEDEIKMASLIRRGLRSEGVAADVAIKGEDALWMAGSTGYDAIVLDVMLPGIDGFQTCRKLREDGIWAPVIMLTARDSVEDRVAGLDGGADDYLTKPFSFAELLARLRALARRGPVERPAVLEVGDLKLDPAPRLDIEEYMSLARYLGVRIEHVLETHTHADHVSGHGRLAAATGAAIHIHAGADAGYEHEPFDDGWELGLGGLRVRALHTPGHR